jgi:hypothetical protein
MTAKCASAEIAGAQTVRVMPAESNRGYDLPATPDFLKRGQPDCVVRTCKRLRTVVPQTPNRCYRSGAM